MQSLSDIIATIQPTNVVGSQEISISELIIASETNQDRNALMWVGNKKLNLLKHITTGVIICPHVPEQIVEKCTYLIVDNPRWAFLSVLRKFFSGAEQQKGVSESAIIDSSASIGKDVFIGANVVIEKGCVVGDGSVIDHNTTIKAESKIGTHCKIGSNCVIGGVGFGYERSPSGKYVLIPHIGNVVIENQVEIGNNTCIDRAVMGSTVLRKNVKVDNLVHIAHGVDVGENSLVIANAMVAGSVKIGKNVWVAPSSSILNGKSVDDNAVIGLGAVVLRNVEAKQVIVGNPGKPLRKKA